jgi:ABC-type multidrug transport system fused ATPase/permease subunit
MPKNNRLIDMNKYNMNLSDVHKLILYGLIIFLMIVLLFKNKYNILVEKTLLFIVLFLLILSITKNIVVTLVTSIILFLILNLFINFNQKKYNQNQNIESFDNSTTEKIKNKLESKKEELKNKLDSSKLLEDFTEKMKNLEGNDNMEKAAQGLQDLLKQLDGGIEIKKSDKEETTTLNVNPDDYKDEDKPDAMRKAQKETYELINMVDSLKTTMESLAPVLSQGKEIMNMFENFKL